MGFAFGFVEGWYNTSFVVGRVFYRFLICEFGGLLSFGELLGVGFYLVISAWV